MFWREGLAPDHEPHKVLLFKGELTDDSRDGRIVPYKVYYPTAHDLTDLPIVIWSHGLGGGRDGAAFLGRYIASNGYIVINVQHAGTDTSIWEGKPGHPWDVIRATEIKRQDSLSRFYDVPFLLDNLDQIAAAKPEIAEHWDTNTIGMSGHSFGAMTTQVMAGQYFPDLTDTMTRIEENRFKAGILYSFVQMKHLTDEPPEKIFGAMHIPLLFMTGTADDNPLTGQSYEYRMHVYESAGCPEKHLLVIEEGDHMVFAGSRGQLSAHPKRHIHEDIIKITSLAYWDTYLKGDEAAREWLNGNAAQDWLDGDAELSFEL